MNPSSYSPRPRGAAAKILVLVFCIMPLVIVLFAVAPAQYAKHKKFKLPSGEAIPISFTGCEQSNGDTDVTGSAHPGTIHNQNYININIDQPAARNFYKCADNSALPCQVPLAASPDPQPVNYTLTRKTGAGSPPGNPPPFTLTVTSPDGSNPKPSGPVAACAAPSGSYSIRRLNAHVFEYTVKLKQAKQHSVILYVKTNYPYEKLLSGLQLQQKGSKYVLIFDGRTEAKFKLRTSRTRLKRVAVRFFDQQHKPLPMKPIP